MAKHLVKCYFCGKQFDANAEEYVKPVSNRYAHKECGKKEEAKKGIILRIHEMMKEILGETYNETKITRQIKKYLKQGKTEIGILQTLEYWYYVKENTAENAAGGIGIVEWIYGEAMNYQEKQKRLQEMRETVKISDYIDDTVTYKIKPKPITKPVGVKLFDLR